MPDPVIPTSVPWYSTESDYLEVVRMMGVENAIPYAQWAEKIVRLEREAANRGGVTARIEIIPTTVKAWCDENGLSFSRESIVKYAMFKLAKRLSKSN